jgi:predicted anti-sigma-YlaC factor YlaD
MRLPLTHWLKHRLPPCIRITEMLSDACERNLSAGEKMLLRMHLRLCAHCRRFSAQIGVIEQAMQEARKEASFMSASRIPPLSYTAREKIRSAIQSQLS